MQRHNKTFKTFWTKQTIRILPILPKTTKWESQILSALPKTDTEWHSRLSSPLIPHPKKNRVILQLPNKQRREPKRSSMNCTRISKSWSANKMPRQVLLALDWSTSLFDRLQYLCYIFDELISSYLQDSAERLDEYRQDCLPTFSIETTFRS